jgi:hypothetical protein
MFYGWIDYRVRYINGELERYWGEQIMKAMQILATCLRAIVIFFILVNAAFSAEVTDAKSDQRLKLLREAWNGQRSAILTGRFKLKLFRYVDLGSQKLPYRAFKDFVDSYVAKGQVDDIGRGIAGLPPTTESHGLFADPVEIWVDGSRTRNEWRLVFDAKAPQVAHKVYDEQNELWYESLHKQASIYRGRTGVEFLGLRDLRWLPWKDFFNNNKTKCDDVKGEFRVTVNENAEIETALPDGFVDRCIFKDKNGTITSEVLQFIKMKYDGNIVMPKVVVSGTFHNSFVYNFDIILIEEAEVNIDIPIQRFIVSAPAETNIVDFRDGLGRARSIMAHSPVQDILKLVNETPKGVSAIGRKAIEPVKRERHSNKQLILVGLSLSLIITSVVLWKWKRRTKSSAPPI